MNAFASRPQTLADVPTPALIVDLPSLDRNIRTMAAYFDERPCQLRPHFKAHKTPEIAARQLAAGSCSGLTCATIFEAEVVSTISSDILIANEIVTTQSCERAALLARHVTLTIAVDSADGVARLAAAAARMAVTIGVLIDINVGQNRCGVVPASESGDALALGRLVTEARALRLRGLMGYEGHAVGIPSRDEREAQVRRSMGLLASTAQAFRAAGLPTDIVSAGGTGSYDISSQFAEITQIQAGSYALMDTEYGKLGLPFVYASYVLGTVVSRPAPDRLVADCGHKSCTKDHGYPAVRGIDGAVVTALNDEHATIDIPVSCEISVGNRIALIPSHTDPTLNLHDALYAVDGDAVVGIWPVAARGYRRG